MYSCRYDSEEERVKERMETLHVKRQVQQQASRERILLEEYRATLKSQQQYHVWTESSTQPDDEYQGNGDSIAIEEHISAWSSFTDMYTHLNASQEEHILVYSDVPWIPRDVSKRKYISYIADTHHEKDVKKAYASICLTWHPDKFQNRFKRVFVLEEWNKVVSTVNETFQEFRDAWNDIILDDEIIV